MELDSIVYGCAPYFIFVGIEFRMNCGFGSGLVTFHLNLCTRFVLDMQTSMVSDSVRIILPGLWTRLFLILSPSGTNSDGLAFLFGIFNFWGWNLFKGIDRH